MPSNFPGKILRCVAQVFGRKRKQKQPRHDVTASTVSPATSPGLPIELFELIIDFCRYDRPTLRACALTCRAWLPRSRYNMFHDVVLHSMKQLGYFSGLVAAEPRFGALVKSLHVAPYRGHGEAYATFPFVLGDKLSRLEHLSIDLRRDFYPCVHDNFLASLSCFSTVTSLALRRVQFPSFHDFALLLAAFPKLAHLHCWQVGWVRKSYDPRAFAHMDCRLRLSELTMRGVDWSEEMVDWLLAYTSPAALVRVRVPLLLPLDVEHVERLLLAAGHTLRHLEIGIVPLNSLAARHAQSKEGTDGHMGPFPRLLQNTCLESLHLNLYGGSWAPGLLAQVASTQLRVLTIGVPTHARRRNVQHFDCCGVDRALALPQFAGLEHVVFEYDKGAEEEWNSKLCEEILPRFPIARAKSLVQCRGVKRDPERENDVIQHLARIRTYNRSDVLSSPPHQLSSNFLFGEVDHDLRRAAGFANKPYNTNSKNKRKPKKASTDIEEFYPARATKPANVKASPDSGPMSNLGMPSRVQYKCIEEDYLKSLHIRKREKALLNQALFDKIWDVLHDPQSILVGTPQFRWWVRKMFVLSYTRSTLSSVETHTVEDYSADSVPVVLHENRPVALKDQIYDVLCYCHDLAKHGGRDKTTAVVREHYSWIPKELIAQFVKACPTCVYKKTGNVDLALAMNTTEGLPGADACNEPSQILSMPTEEQSQRRVTTHCVSLRVSDLISRDSASPSRDLTQYWPTTSGPLHSPAPVHPMPPLQSWMDTALYNTQDTSSHASEVYLRATSNAQAWQR
ncbi:hypothetical protein IEO21_05451 [Rhodonia placenta]|uniref:Integrase zinc-binding domain-containing protein n=1 Tax=Rhodonia placenta TaxID=104341 RepID=A0A8H7P1W3_9APHY|nr:hypothetical protein IEO21_05451 [Postia placenta]